MQNYDHDPDNAYIIAHVSNVQSSSPRVEFLLNPASLARTGELDIDRWQREEDDPGTRRARLTRFQG